MLNRRSFLASLASTLALLDELAPGLGADDAQRERHVRAVQRLLPDGRAAVPGRQDARRLRAPRRGREGRAREGAAEGRTVIVAHGGDTLSPSVMSGLDRGAHIIALTNMIAPDIFVPGNHEFDFGKAMFLERMARGDVPALRRELARRGRRAAAAASRTARSSTVDGVRIGLTGLAYEQSPRMSSPEDLRFGSDDRHHQGAGRGAAAGGRGLRLRGPALQSRRRASRCNTRAPPNCCSPATRTTCSSITTASARWSSPATTRTTSPASTSRSRCARTAASAAMTWWPQFRVIDTASVTPDPEVAAAVARFEQTLTRQDERGDLHHGGRARFPHRDGAHARGRDRQPVRRRDARRHAGGRRGAQRRRHPRRQDLRRRARASRQGDILAELPFNNRVVVVEITGARSAGARWRTGCRCCRSRAGASRRSPASTLQFDLAREPGSRVTAMQVGGAPLDEDKTYRVAVLDFLARGGDDYTMFRDAKRITPDNDAPLMVNEVVDYICASSARCGRGRGADRGERDPLGEPELEGFARSRPDRVAARPRSPCRRSAASRARRASRRP